MFLNDSDASAHSATDHPNSGTTAVDVHPRAFVPSLTHTDIHPKAQHGCERCPPTPCGCGWIVGTCPQAFEHRRTAASSETYWRELNRG
jgi:hypothetical protein